MAIEITYQENDNGCLFTVIGNVTGQDILNAHKKVISNKRFKNLKYWLIDRTQCTGFKPTPDELIEISKTDNIAAEANPNLLVAIVAITDLQYGMSRLYSTYIDEHGFKTCIFKIKDDAEKWINNELLA